MNSVIFLFYEFMIGPAATKRNWGLGEFHALNTNLLKSTRAESFIQNIWRHIHSPGKFTANSAAQRVQRKGGEATSRKANPESTKREITFLCRPNE